jgi:pSer/pThr/pTyr-binding forkhead associated (FHA) protein
MTKLTVFLNYKETYSKQFESGRVVHVGRDETNDIVINSPEVAPIHLAITIHDHDSRVKQLNNHFPLIINGKAIGEAVLNNSDMITMGKHSLVYNTVAESLNSIPFLENNTSHPSFSQENNSELFVSIANLQAMNGPNIGKILSLKKAMTRLGHTGNGVIVIVKRKEGYFISALEKTHNITVNSIPLDGNYLKLAQGDVITLNKTMLQFFLMTPTTKQGASVF